MLALLEPIMVILVVGVPPFSYVLDQPDAFLDHYRSSACAYMAMISEDTALYAG